jgi:hypothetical protein
MIVLALTMSGMVFANTLEFLGDMFKCMNSNLMECRDMKVSELIVALERYDQSADVVIASTPYGKYFNFKIKEQRGLAVTEGAPNGAVTLEVAEEISQYTLAL